MRLNKFIAQSGFCSRRKADKLIEEGRVHVNNRKAEMGMQISEGDEVIIDGELITMEGKEDIYLIFNKPIGVISSDGDADNNVFDYIDIDERLFYVGRLDVASSGLMLFTNNGQLANAITSSENEIEKEYIVTLTEPANNAFFRAMKNGIMLEDRKTKPATVKKISQKKFHLTITEGRNRQIRKMCEALGYEVKSLKRIRIANLRMRDLGEGNYRHLTKKERRTLEALLH